jgi:peptide/nickel transport system substrate-binding protein
MKKNLLVLGIFAIALTFTFSSCGRQKNDGTQSNTETDKTETPLIAPDIDGAVQGDWVIQQELADAEKLNPLVSSDATATEISNYIFEGLVRVNRETYEIEPVLAKALPEVSEDKLIYTFDLKENVTFSDGKPLTGEDIIFTLKIIKNPFADAQALRNYFLDTKKVELVDGNPYKIRFTMAKPYYKTLWTFEDLKVVPKHLLNKDGLSDNFTFEDLDNAALAPDPKKFADMQNLANFINSQEVSRDPKYVLGSGPYKLENWITGTSITLARNDNYWNKAEIPQYPNKLVFKTIQDQTAALTSLKNGEIDNMNIIRTEDYVDGLKNPEQFNLQKSLVGRPTYAYIAWNSKNPLFSDKKVRLALGHLVDRNTIMDKLLYGLAVPIQSHIYYKSDELNKDLAPIDFDIEKAKQLLKEAGWEDSNGDGVIDKMINGKRVDFKFTFTNNQNPKRRQVLMVVIDALKQAGIQADIQDFEWSVFLDKQSKHQYDATYGGWVLGDGPSDPYQIFHSSQSNDEGSNYISYSNSESDEIIEQLRVEFDPAKRKELIMRWQEIIYEDQPYTFLWSQLSTFATNDRFRNTRWYAHSYPNKNNEWWTSASDRKYKE